MWGPIRDSAPNALAATGQLTHTGILCGIVIPSSEVRLQEAPGRLSAGWCYQHASGLVSGIIPVLMQPHLSASWPKIPGRLLYGGLYRFMFSSVVSDVHHVRSMTANMTADFAHGHLRLSIIWSEW